MKSRITFKIIFVVILSLILIGLIFIIFDKAGTSAHVYNPIILADYTIVNESKECVEEKELIYEDDRYYYYLPCASSYDIYLQWSDGDKDLLKNAINSNKVDIASLIDHGLEVVKNEK